MQAISREIVADDGVIACPERLGRVTASEFATVMSVGKKGGEALGRIKYRTALALERINQVRVEGYKSGAMQDGNDTEDLARLRYILKTGNDARKCGFFAHEKLMAGASPDSLIGSDGLQEIKCPEPVEHSKTLRLGKLPSKYFYQVQGQLWMTGRKWCDFTSFNPTFPKNAQLCIIRVERDEERISDLAYTVEQFINTVDEEEKFLREFRGQNG